MKATLVHVVILVLATAAMAEEPITVAGRVIRLGMPQAAVLRALGESVTLQTGWMKPNAASAFVWTKDDPPRYVAQLIFTDGRLSSVGRTWTTQPLQTPEDVARTLIAAIRSAANGALCTAMIKSQDQPDAQVSSLEVNCGRHSISLAVIQSPMQSPSETVTVEEWIRGKVGARK